ncbi:DNA-binding transcriptional regulator YhcF (GntR family) [Bradyrhizobium sp. JR7.2]|uniref:hypothetical protein n=1 Tax=Bradyrhizobium sp. JR7.2 TaxID=3156375 RepID=UPI003390DF3B
MTTIKQPKSWRDVIKVHPAADMLPAMTADEKKALGEDIKKNRLHQRVTLYGSFNAVETWQLLDGRNRLDAMELVGVPIFATDGTIRDDLWAFRPDYQVDPYEFVLSANVHRRHLTPEQKRDVIAKLLKAQPEKSDRQIAGQIKVSPSTVGKVRKGMETSGDVSKLDTRTDARGRKQQAHKPPKQKDPAIAAAADRAVARSALMGATPGAEPPVDASKWQAEVDRLKAENDGLRAEIFEMKRAFWGWGNVLKRRTGALTKAEYNSILSCLHPDSRNSASEAKLGSAFRLFNRLRYVMCNDQEMPFPEKYHPTVQELKARQQYVAEKKAAEKAAKREARRAAKTPQPVATAKVLGDAP